MRRNSLLCLLSIILIFHSAPLWGQEISALTTGQRLQHHFIKELDPEKMTIVFDEEPNENGYIRDMYMDIQGAIIGGVRIKSLSLRAMGVQLSPITTWGEEGPEVNYIMNIHAKGVICEDDINRNLLQKEFGDDDHWHNIQLDISPDGIYAKGYYLVRLLLKLDILIEIESRLKIVNQQQIWLDDYKVRVNRVDVPDFVTEKAVSQIQPLLDLSKFVFPLKLTSIAYDDTSITLSSAKEPEPFDGIIYRYEKESLNPIMCSAPERH